jgi:hypothetical protein
MIKLIIEAEPLIKGKIWNNIRTLGRRQVLSAAFCGCPVSSKKKQQSW